MGSIKVSSKRERKIRRRRSRPPQNVALGPASCRSRAVDVKELYQRNLHVMDVQ